MRFAQIYNNKAHWIFEAETMPEFAPDIVLVEITDNPEVQEGWDYNEETNTFTASIPIITPQPIPQPTNQEISKNQLIIMDVLATMYEDMLAKGTV